MTDVIVRARRISWEHVNRDLKGENGLIAAIICQAYVDLAAGCAEAAAYFLGPFYRHHLDLLGKPDHWLPEGVRVESNGAGIRVIVEEEAEAVREAAT